MYRQFLWPSCTRYLTPIILCPWVIVYEKVFFFFKKKCLQHFNVKTSSTHEGTNFGLKEDAATVLPSYSIDVAGKNLIISCQ